MKHILRLLTVIAITLSFIVPSIAQDEPEPEDLLMTFIPNIQFAPTYVAIVNGYFEDAGFDVSLQYLNEPDVVELIAAGQHDFGIVSGEQVILAAARQRPIVYVYEWFQEYPIGIVYSADREVNSIEDLMGLRIGIPGRFGATYSGLTTLLESAQLAETDFQVEEIGFAAPEVFCVGAVDASVIYVNNEPLQIRNRAQSDECGDVADVNVLPVSEVVDLVSNGIITSQNVIEESPERVSAFVAAYDVALRDAINNPARAYLLSEAFIEGLPLDDDFRAALESIAAEQEAFLADDPDSSAIYQNNLAAYEQLAEQFDADTLIQYEVLLASIALWDAEQLGFSDLGSWQNMQDTLLSLGVLEDAIDLESVFTNDFLPVDDDA